VGFEPTRECNPLPVFKTGALNHSATLPTNKIKHLDMVPPEHSGNGIGSWTQLGPKAFYSALTLANKASMTSAALSSVFVNRWP
jgi:hypothetical protein